MDARTGKNIRKARLFNAQSGRTVIVAYSHSSFMGPLPGLSTLEETVANAHKLRRANGMMVSPGFVAPLEEVFCGQAAPSLIVQIDWQSFSRETLPRQSGTAVFMATVEDVAVAGADAVMSYLYLGHDDPQVEKEEIARNARLVRECERAGILLMIEPRYAGSVDRRQTERQTEIMKLYSRITCEVGADIVKLIEPARMDDLADIVSGCSVPVLLAGGAKRSDFNESVRTANRAVAAGCAGVVYGRNLFQHHDPARALDAVLTAVHAVVSQPRQE